MKSWHAFKERFYVAKHIPENAHSSYSHICTQTWLFIHRQPQPQPQLQPHINDKTNSGRVKIFAGNGMFVSHNKRCILLGCARKSSTTLVISNCGKTKSKNYTQIHTHTHTNKSKIWKTRRHVWHSVMPPSTKWIFATFWLLVHFHL